jgi:Asp-tRNA(Asn)/Glu-tRNA(Gln) amidotransferase A subunit family amidase
MAASDQICQLDTATLARRIAAKELSPVEAVEAVLERLERLDPTLHMSATVVADQARQQAKRIEADIAAGRGVGPLAGVPTGVKDLIYTKGIRTASGSHAYGVGRSRWAATAAARCASPPAAAGSTASSRRWAGSRCTPAPRTTATLACRAGSPWSTSAR